MATLLDLLADAKGEIGRRLGKAGESIQQADWGKVGEAAVPAIGAYLAATSPAFGGASAKMFEEQKKNEKELAQKQAENWATLVGKNYIPGQTGTIPVPADVQKYIGAPFLNKISSIPQAPSSLPNPPSGYQWGVKYGVDKDTGAMYPVPTLVRRPTTAGPNKMDAVMKRQYVELLNAQNELNRLEGELFKPSLKLGKESTYTGKLAATNVPALNIPLNFTGQYFGNTMALQKDLDAFKQTITKMSDVGAITESDRAVIGGLIDAVKQGNIANKRDAFNRIRMRLQSKQDAIMQASQMTGTMGDLSEKVKALEESKEGGELWPQE